jgi:hypothetical protein
MPGYLLKHEIIEVIGAAALNIRSLLDRQQYADPVGAAQGLGISSAAWPLFGLVWPSGLHLAAAMARWRCHGKRLPSSGWWFSAREFEVECTAADAVLPRALGRAGGVDGFRAESRWTVRPDHRQRRALRAGRRRGAVVLHRPPRGSCVRGDDHRSQPWQPIAVSPPHGGDGVCAARDTDPPTLVGDGGCVQRPIAALPPNRFGNGFAWRTRVLVLNSIHFTGGPVWPKKN